MNKLQRMRLSALIAAMGALGVGSGLAVAQPQSERAPVQARAHLVECSEMPGTTAIEARQLRSCYEVEIESAPADVTDEEIAEAKAAAVCVAIADPAQRPDACSLFAPHEGSE